MRSKLVISFLITIALLISILPIVSALSVSNNMPDITKQDTNKNIIISAIGNTSACSFTIYDNDGNSIYSNLSLNPTINASVLAIKGRYKSISLCSNGTVNEIYNKDFLVTQSGLDPAGDILSGIIYLLFCLASIGLIYTLFLTVVKFAIAEEKVSDVLISWSLYILMMIVNYLGKEYLLRTYIENLSGWFLTVTMWTNVLLPLLAFIYSFFIIGISKKKPPSVQELRGNL